MKVLSATPVIIYGVSFYWMLLKAYLFFFYKLVSFISTLRFLQAVFFSVCITFGGENEFLYKVQGFYWSTICKVE